jgi:hypothetical protein
MLTHFGSGKFTEFPPEQVRVVFAQLSLAHELRETSNTRRPTRRHLNSFSDKFKQNRNLDEEIYKRLEIGRFGGPF